MLVIQDQVLAGQQMMMANQGDIGDWVSLLNSEVVAYAEKQQQAHREAQQTHKLLQALHSESSIAYAHVTALLRVIESSVSTILNIDSILFSEYLTFSTILVYLLLTLGVWLTTSGVTFSARLPLLFGLYTGLCVELGLVSLLVDRWDIDAPTQHKWVVYYRYFLIFVLSGKLVSSYRVYQDHPTISLKLQQANYALLTELLIVLRSKSTTVKPENPSTPSPRPATSRCGAGPNDTALVYQQCPPYDYAQAKDITRTVCNWTAWNAHVCGCWQWLLPVLHTLYPKKNRPTCTEPPEIQTRAEPTTSLLTSVPSNSSSSSKQLLVTRFFPKATAIRSGEI